MATPERMLLRRTVSSLVVLASCSLAPTAARADGGELSLSTHYAPSVTLLRAADATYRAPGVVTSFGHVVGVDAVYALSNRIGAGVGGELLWPQSLVAHKVDYRVASGQTKSDATVSLREQQLGVGGLIVVQTDRRQAWDVSLTLGAGLQATRWHARSFSLVRSGNVVKVADSRTSWVVRPVYSVRPAVTWRLGEHVQVSFGPRVTLSQRGTLRFSAAAQVGVPIPVGPSF